MRPERTSFPVASPKPTTWSAEIWDGSETAFGIGHYIRVFGSRARAGYPDIRREHHPQAPHVSEPLCPSFFSVFHTGHDGSLADGREHFGHHCSICHGLDGEATGVPFADKMSPPVPSLSSKDVQDYADGQLKWIIENGINPSGMPAWKGILSNEKMWKV
jgi:hypothetical protein